MALPRKQTNPYQGVAKIFKRYWRAYGGLGALCASPYVHFSVVLTALLRHLWISGEWWSDVLQVVPSILGFTLAGFTIWLGFGDDRFQQLITKWKPGRESSPYLGISAGFVHFIVVQLLAVLAALIGKATDFALACDDPLRPLALFAAPWGHAVGFFLFIYSLMTALAATMGVFRTASMFEQERRNRREPRTRPPRPLVPRYFPKIHQRTHLRRLPPR